MKLKMWTGNYDGERRGLVITTSKTKAAKLAHASVHHFSEYWNECDIIEGLLPDTIYTQPYDIHTNVWMVGRCETKGRR